MQIINVLFSEKTHPNATEILKKVRKVLPKISLSTVYFTLDMLKKERLIKEIDFYDKDNRYDNNISPHINLICKNCGNIYDYEKDISITVENIEQETGFLADDMRFEYYGICRKCRK